MTDYISREAAMNFELSVKADPAEIQAITKGMALYAEHISSIPAADVAPVVHGRWIERPYLLGTTIYCSRCGENYGMPHAVYNFCPQLRGKDGWRRSRGGMPQKERQSRPVSGMTIADIVHEAAKLGMTYGKYIAQMDE